MEEYINNKNNQLQQNDLVSIINELKKKYEILEDNQKKYELKNRSAILGLNENINLVKASLDEFKSQCENNIAILRKNIFDINNENKINKNGNEFVEEINKFTNKYDNFTKDIDKKIDELKIEIKEIKMNINNMNKNNICINNDGNINNNVNNNINNNINNKANNNINNIELKIDKDEEKTIFQKFENLLARIIDKNDIDDKIKEELKETSEKLMINDIIPHEYTAQYFAITYKYLREQNEKNEKYKKNEEEENVKKILIINKKIFEVLEQIEKELTIKIKNLKKVKKSNKKVDKKIQEFRDKHSISEEDASDEKIKEYLKLYNNDELKACEEILRSILGEKNNKIKK